MRQPRGKTALLEGFNMEAGTETPNRGGTENEAGLVFAPVHKDCKTPAGRSIRRVVSTGILVGVAEIMALAALSFAVTLHWAFFLAGRRAQRRLACVTTPLANARWSAKTLSLPGVLGVYILRSRPTIVRQRSR